MQVGPRYGYPRLSRYSQRLAVVAELARPFTVFSAFLVGLFLGLILSAGPALPVLLGLLFAAGQAAGQTINQIADVDIDRINKPYRPIPSGKITVAEAYLVAALFVLLGALFAGAILLYVDNWLAVASSYAIMYFFAVFYSLEPIRAKGQGAWFSLVWQAAARGLMPPIYASWIVAGSPLRLWPLSLLAFLWVLSLQSTKDFGDVEGDRAFGIETLPIRYGVKGAVRVMQAMTVVYAVVDLLLYVSGYVTPWLLLMIPVAFSAFWALGRQTVTENNLAWNIYYIGLAMHYILYLL